MLNSENDCIQMLRNVLNLPETVEDVQVIWAGFVFIRNVEIILDFIEKEEHPLNSESLCIQMLRNMLNFPITVDDAEVIRASFVFMGTIEFILDYIENSFNSV